MIARHVATAMILVGLIFLARGVMGAESPRPYVAALVKYENGKREVRYLYQTRTACALDAARPLNGERPGLRISCEEVK